MSRESVSPCQTRQVAPPSHLRPPFEDNGWPELPRRLTSADPGEARMLDLLLTLHILVFVFAFAFTAGIGILSARIVRSRDARLIHSVFVTARPLQWAGGVGWFVAGALGAGFAVEAGLPFDAPWLVWSYAAFAVLVVAGLGLH